jgi:hypothetical protein
VFDYSPFFSLALLKKKKTKQKTTYLVKFSDYKVVCWCQKINFFYLNLHGVHASLKNKIKKILVHSYFLILQHLAIGYNDGSYCSRLR